MIDDFIKNYLKFSNDVNRYVSRILVNENTFIKIKDIDPHFDTNLGDICVDNPYKDLMGGIRVEIDNRLPDNEIKLCYD